MPYNVMAKRERTKGQTMIYKTRHRNLMLEQHERGCELRCSGRVSSSCSSSGTSGVTIEQHELH